MVEVGGRSLVMTPGVGVGGLINNDWSRSHRGKGLEKALIIHCSGSTRNSREYFLGCKLGVKIKGKCVFCLVFCV